MKIQFAENLKLLRTNAKFTQKQLAEKLGVDQRTVSAWEKSICEPDFAVLEKLCEILTRTLMDYYLSQNKYKKQALPFGSAF